MNQPSTCTFVFLVCPLFALSFVPCQRLRKLESFSSKKGWSQRFPILMVVDGCFAASTCFYHRRSPHDHIFGVFTQVSRSGDFTHLPYSPVARSWNWSPVRWAAFRPRRPPSTPTPTPCERRRSSVEPPVRRTAGDLQRGCRSGGWIEDSNSGGESPLIAYESYQPEDGTMGA